MDADFWYIVGRWLGDGWTMRRKSRNNNLSRVVISCNHKYVDYLKERIERCFHCNIARERTATKFHILNKEFATFLEQFGHGASGKFVPQFVIDLPIHLLKSFIDGYLESDGCITQNSWKFSSVSRKLIYGMAQCIMKVYKCPVSVYRCCRPESHVIEGRTVSQKDTYDLVCRFTDHCQGFFENGYVWYLIRSVENTGTMETVYDISVADSHSFVVNNCIVHNCQSISIAGKQNGMTLMCDNCGHKIEITKEIYEKLKHHETYFCPECGHELKLTRSGLFFEALRIIEETKPKVAIAENVKNLTGKKFATQFATVLSSLDYAGYNNYWKVLNAKDYGVPQNRERVFIVSIRKDVDNGRFEFPKGFPLTKRLKDVLEDTVDEKYYLNTGAAENLLKQIIEKYAITDKEPVDGSVNDPHVKTVSNCIKARYDNGISNFKSDGMAVVERCGTDKINMLGMLDMKGAEQVRRVYDTNGIAPTLNTMQGGNRQPKIVVNDTIIDDTQGFDGIRVYDGISPTLRAGRSGLKTCVSQDDKSNADPFIVASRGRYVKDANGTVSTEQKLEPNCTGMSNTLTTVQKDNLVAVPVCDVSGDITYFRVRKLTPRECYRLMDFDDSDFEKACAVNSNTQLYKQAGNSIVVSVPYYIFKELFRAGIL